MRYRKFLFIFTGCVLFVLGVSASVQFFRHHQKLILEPSPNSQKAKGNPAAKVKIIEFSDFQCPACRKGAFYLDRYIKKYPSLFYLEFKYYPIASLHPHARRIAVFAECAARQRKFWLFHDIVFQLQEVLRSTSAVDERLLDVAGKLGLDVQELQACVSEEDVLKKVLKEEKEGLRLGIRATPAYIINGKKIVGAGQLREELQKYVDGLPLP